MRKVTDEVVEEMSPNRLVNMVKDYIIIIIISLFKEDNILSNTITYLTYGPL